MEIIIKIFGEGTDLNTLQMSSRAVVVFIIALILVRISGRRSFSMRSAFDNVITLLLGAILSRAVYGASPFFPTVTACLVIVLLHRLAAWLSIYSRRIGYLVKGEKTIVFDMGKIIKTNLSRILMSEEDLKEEVRKENKKDSFQQIEKIYVERNGDVSIITTPSSQ